MVVELSAWGWDGPWAERRGFDSIVQAATGIAMRCADHDGTPGALPAQALDHATGYRAVAAALEGVRRRPEEGGRLVRLSLLAAAEALLGYPAPAPVPDPRAAAYDAGPHLGSAGPVRYARPPFRLGDEPVDHPFPARPYGADAPEWRAEPPQPEISHSGASTGMRGSGDATRPNRSVPADQSL